MNARLAALADALEKVDSTLLARFTADSRQPVREAAAIVRALAEQEPVAWTDPDHETILGEWQRASMVKFPGTRASDLAAKHTVPLYTHPKIAP